jgi:hypothetical protein
VDVDLANGIVIRTHKFVRLSSLHHNYVPGFPFPLLTM